ncbi:hypothetical protein B0H34DRAFT_800188 [Crassisporium funariophilum]|nr:hypothetical protein B0H34DRAFT_800188 [Crassisporium funariophilum]
MPAVHSKLPLLSLVESLGDSDQLYSYPAEREIDREALLDVAPDREELLMGSKTIEEIRQALKLRITSPHHHWLSRIQTRREVKLKDATTRLSVFGRLGPTNLDENTDDETTSDSLHVVRRVLSASSLYPTHNAPMRSIGNTMDLFNDASLTLDIWNKPALSNEEKLISPRPLVATHILVIYAMNPAIPNARLGDEQTLRRRRGNVAPTYPEVAELPINDLLFILNVPNLLCAGNQTFEPILPRRLHKEMPRVLLHVPHLETFSELVRYLHTKNQAELFRKLIPEWIRDLMHPLPLAQSALAAFVPVATTGAIAPVRRLLGMLVAGATSNSSLNTLDSIDDSVPSETERSIAAIALELADAALESGYEDSVFHTATLLHALRDNLHYIGFYSKDLWYELDACRDILLRAISHQAKVVTEDSALLG